MMDGIEDNRANGYEDLHQISEGNMVNMNEEIVDNPYKKKLTSLRAEVVAAQIESKNKLDWVPTASLVVAVIALLRFYIYTPVTSKMMLTDFILRIFLIGASGILIWFLLRVIELKMQATKKQMAALDKKFSDYNEIFEGLSKTSVYDGTGEDFISKIELGCYKMSYKTSKSTESLSRFIGAIYLLNFWGAILMLIVCIWEFTQ